MDRKKLSRSRALHDYEFQRAYKACVPCARRKVKCEPGEGEKCLRCTKKRIDCTFTSKKPWSRASKDEPSMKGRDSQREKNAQLQMFAICIFIPDLYLFSKASRSRSTPHDQSGTKDGHLPTSMLQKVVSNNKDAMDILFEAALREESQQNTEQITTAPIPTLVPQRLTTTDALQMWNACRFVKMGWFSAHEAMTLVDLSVFTLHKNIVLVLMNVIVSSQI